MIMRKRQEIKLKRLMIGNFIISAIKGIQRENGDPDDLDYPLLMKPFLHKINLTTDWSYCLGAYKKLQGKFGNFYIDNNFNPDIRMPNYGKRLIKNMADYDIFFFTDSHNCVAPHLIEIHPKEKTTSKQIRELLHSLNELFMVLNVSSIEYAIDLYCHDRKAIKRLFRTLIRYIHVHYSRGASNYGQKIDLSNNTGINSILRMGHLKIYERGPDGKKNESCWNTDDCDRIRLELTAERSIFRKHGIKTVDNLLEKAQFQKINEDIYKFKWFEGSRKLPQCWNAYTASDDCGNKNCLQYEINHFRSIVLNINQYLKDVKAFDPLNKALLDAMIRFDKEWHD
jgi:hypothetical protein